MSLFKKSNPVPSKTKGEAPAKGKSETPVKPRSTAGQFTHPPLEPLGIVALENVFCPLFVKGEGISCHIEMVGADYQVRTLSGQREISSEIIPPTDRKKKAVTEFMFKGLIGIHLHPGGMVLTLDQEKNSQGQPRLHQPPLELTGAAPPEEIDSLRSRRLFTYSLSQCTPDKPLVIATNKEHMHMQIRLLESEGEDEWGMFISSPKGMVRDDSKPVLILKKGIRQRIDRPFFTQLAGASGGGIDARTWNRDVHDPIIMEISVDENNLLTIEEMFTVHGLTLLTETEKVSYVGIPHGNTPEQQEAHLKECEKTVLHIRDAILEGLVAHALEMSLAKDRKNIVRSVSTAIHKANRDGVGILALELAVKEVLAPVYAGASGSETSMSVSHETLRLLNAITNELSGWVDADATKDTAIAAMIQGINDSAHLKAEGIDQKLIEFLPKSNSGSAETDTPMFGDVVSLVTRTLASKLFAKETKTLAKELAATEDRNIKATLGATLDLNIKRHITTLLHKSLVRLAVKSHLLNLEKAKRDALKFDPTQVSDQPVSDRELETILTRYDAYSEYLDRACEARINKPLSGIIRDFQIGTNDEQMHSLSTKSFLAYLVALRTSGGTVSEKTDNVPAVSSLQALPDAIPDIQVMQPDPGEPKGMVRVVHREGVLLEAEFNMAPRSGSAPEGVPNNVWFAFRDLAERVMEFHLTSETQKKRDRDQVNLAITSFTKLLLLKVLNLYRNLQNVPSRKDFEQLQEVLEKAVGILSIHPGESADDELLDIRNRPKQIAEPAMNIRQELRQMLLAMEKEGALEKDAFRFKQRVRSFALMGGGKNQEKVVLPIVIRAQAGLVNIDAKFNDETFGKAIRLVQAGDGTPTESPDTTITRFGSPKVPGQPGSPTAQAPTQPQPKPSPEKTREDQIRANRIAIFKLVNSLPFFSRFSEYEKKRIAEQDVSFKMFHKDEYIIEDGTHDTAFFVLLKGTVRVTKGNKIITRLGPGEMFGEISFLTNTPRTMNIKANENVLVLRMDQDMMNHLEQESREKFKDHIINRQVARLAETTDRLVGPAAIDVSTVIAPPLEGEIRTLDRDTSMALIDKLPFFAQFSAYEKKRITAFNTSFRTFRANGEIIREGTLDTSFFIIINGKVNVVKGGIVIAQLGPGDFFGDMAFLTNSQRTSSVISQGEVLVMRVDQDLMKRMGSEIREKLKDQFLIKLTQRLLQTTGKTLKNSAPTPGRN
ncbi:MAG: cyclic nucleotide-binding domain-containing protein [Magnetococcales bacterium]|nr:cyclic nucleotide-binding domain-containing protein [Magnetococcales bacterium]MBF0149238.1 cyclic nucleotide-binding domain-containing protein [Magnetococcales bacterium]MBF0630587.1 cyclic nucleotide-binding domain-containing protein [Magnetococcales bacterium]